MLRSAARQCHFSSAARRSSPHNPSSFVARSFKYLVFHHRIPIAIAPPRIFSLKSSSAPMRRHRLAVVQTTSTADLDTNRKTAHRFVREARATLVWLCAAAGGASLVCFPENFLFLGSTRGVELAETLDGPLVKEFSELAKEAKISILMGSILEKIAADPARIYNTSVLLDRNGITTGVYRKIHLFDLNLPTVQLMESKTAAAGNELTVVDHEVGKLGMSICYDIRFPAMYQKMTAMGAEVIFVPSAFTVPTGAAHWMTLLQARAIENQVFIVAPAQIGKHNEKRQSFGSSCVIDPWGTVINRAPEHECLFFADLDFSTLSSVRANMPVLTHRVPGIDH